MCALNMAQWETPLKPSVEKRILNAANHSEPDRPPFWDHLSHPGVFEHFSREEDDPSETAARAYRELGIEVCRGYNLTTLAGAESETEPEQRPDAEDLRRELRRDQWGEAEWERFAHKLLREYHGVRDLLAPHTLYVPMVGTGLTDLYVAMGYERFCYAIKDQPDLIGSVLRRRAEENRRWVEYAASERICPLFLVAEDIGGKTGLLFSPGWLHEHFIPALKNLVAPLHDAGIKVIFHSDGNVMQMLDELVEAGIDGLHPIEPLAGMDLARLKKEYGNELILVGNVDCGRLLPSGTPEEIRRNVAECREAASGGGGHFIGSSGELHDGIPLENVFAFCEACKRTE